MPARGAIHAAPGRPWAPLDRHEDRHCEELAGLRQAEGWVTPNKAKSQETRPGAEPEVVATALASAAVERRKASAARRTRCRAASAAIWLDAPLGAPPPLFAREAFLFRAVVRKARA